MITDHENMKIQTEQQSRGDTHSLHSSGGRELERPTHRTLSEICIWTPDSLSDNESEQNKTNPEPDRLIRHGGTKVFLLILF